MKVLKNFISHALFVRKLLETLFHPSKAVSEPRKKEEDLVHSAQRSSGFMGGRLKQA